MGITFQLVSADQSPVTARAGLLATDRGEVPTPAFMPVGTLGTVKALVPEEISAAGGRIVLVNAYHLYLRPGHEVVERLGGIHRFMRWEGPVLSDSGGFQVFSLARLGRVDEEGVRFRSHLDGSEHFYTPELAMAVQRALGVDIAMPLDHVLQGGAEHSAAKDAAERTVRWYERCRLAAGDLATFAIVQGGVHADLRRWQAGELVALDAPGYSIGGLSVGESKEEMWGVVPIVTAALPVDRPRYLMGVGSPEDLVNGVGRGVDLFDCVLPTRLGRNGSLFTSRGRRNVHNAEFRLRDAPIEEGCDCYTCSGFSLAYLHHLFRNEELLGYRLATIHNLRFVLRLMEQMRVAILAGGFQEFAEEFLGQYRPVDEEVRRQQKAKWLAQAPFEDKL